MDSSSKKNNGKGDDGDGRFLPDKFKANGRKKKKKKKTGKRQRLSPSPSSSNANKNKKKSDNNVDGNTAMTGNNSTSANNVSIKISFPMGACSNVSERFEKVGRVGEGTYGVVYKARDRLAKSKIDNDNNNNNTTNSRDYVALKRCIPHHQANDGFPITTIREIYSLRILQHHPNIISLRYDISNGIVVSKHDTFLVFEYCEHDLAQLLDHYYHNPKSSSRFMSNATRKKSPFQLSHVKTLLQQLLSAVDCIHSHYLIHRDLKLSNLLYTNTGQLKVCDFGLSRTIGGGGDTSNDNNNNEQFLMTPNVVSLWYRPPELLLGCKKYGSKIDIWAIGCIMAELLQGYPLWNGSNEQKQINKIFTTLGVPKVNLWPAVVTMPAVQNGDIDLSVTSSTTTGGGITSLSSSATLLDTFSYLSSSGLILMTNLLHYNNEKRWTAAQALQSKFFSSSESPVPTIPSEMPKFPSLHK